MGMSAKKDETPPYVKNDYEPTGNIPPLKRISVNEQNHISVEK